MVGSALLRHAHRLGWSDVVTATRSEVNLLDRPAVDRFFAEKKPAVVIVAAAKVGGIVANATQPAAFLAENLAIALNVIEAARLARVRRLLFLGSSCIYPKMAPQPIPENALLTGALEPTNEGYAIAKIAGLKLCQTYRRQHGVLFHSAMPTNLYGPGDNYHPEHSHVLPALIRRCHEARLRGDTALTIWGTGTPRREFLFVDDLAEACFHLLGLENPPDWVNIGTGDDIPILDAARLVAETVGFHGQIVTDPSRPDGTPRKLLDTALMASLGWTARTPLKDGLARTYEAFQRESDRAGFRA